MKKKRILTMILCLVLVVGAVAACGNSNNSGSGTPSAQTPDTEDITDNADNSEGDSNKSSNKTADDDYPLVVMAMMNFTGAPKGLDRVQKLISAYTEENLGVRFQLMIMDGASYKQTMTLMLTSGEQVDIFTAISLGYTSCVNKDFCLNLEEDGLIDTYGAGILEIVDKAYIDGCRIGGKLYGLPQHKDMATGLFSFSIGAEYLEGIGYDYASKYTSDNDEIIHTGIDEISDIFAQLHEKYPDKYVYIPQEANLSQGLMVDFIGGDTFGVLLDPANSLKVEDLYSSDIFKEYCQVFYDWNQAGYISADALTDDTPAATLIQTGTVMAYGTAAKPGLKKQDSNLCGRDMIVFQCGEDFMKSTSLANMPWCINSNTADPAAAMKVLNAFYTDPYMSNLLCWGEEGRDWKAMDDGHITFADGVTVENSEYFHNVNWLTPNQFIAGIWEGISLDVWEKTKAFNNEAERSIALGFAFDNSDVSSTYTALTNVYDGYVKALCYGFTDPETGIPELVKNLKAAGLDEYIAAKQEALDQWSAANGVTDKQDTAK